MGYTGVYFMEQINSDINIIGGIPDFALIEAVLAQLAEGKGDEALWDMLVTSNTFDFRTESSRERFLRAVMRSIAVYGNDNQKQLVECLFRAPGLENLKRRVIFWQLLVGNDLFRLISTEVYAKVYFSGRTTIVVEDIFAYLKDLQQGNEQLQSFSDLTLQTIASKYLTVLKKFGLADGRTKKRILNVRLAENEILFFVYFLLSVDGSVRDVLRSPFRDFFFLEKAELTQALKNIKYMPFIDLTSTGDVLTVQLKLTPQELVDAISH